MTDEDREPAYWSRNSCGAEVDAETAECCDDGENEPSYDEAPDANSEAPNEVPAQDMFDPDYYAEHVDPDADGYLFGTAMGR